MDSAPQDFVNLISSYLPWPDRRMIYDNSNLFDKAYSDKLFIADIALAASSSQEIKIETLISELYSAYVLIERQHYLDDPNTTVIPGSVVAEQIIAIIEDEIKSIRKRKLKLDMSVGLQHPYKFVVELRVYDDCMFRMNMSIVSSVKNIKKIGAYLCELNKDIEIDVREVKHAVELYAKYRSDE